MTQITLVDSAGRKQYMRVFSVVISFLYVLNLGPIATGQTSSPRASKSACSCSMDGHNAACCCTASAENKAASCDIRISVRYSLQSAPCIIDLSDDFTGVSIRTPSPHLMSLPFQPDRPQYARFAGQCPIYSAYSAYLGLPEKVPIS